LAPGFGLRGSVVRLKARGKQSSRVSAGANDRHRRPSRTDSLGLDAPEGGGSPHRQHAVAPCSAWSAPRSATQTRPPRSPPNRQWALAPLSIGGPTVEDRVAGPTRE
jgi:hypothetical protein